jgi:hypothetical protein
MKFLYDEDGLAINMANITAIKIKPNKNDGSFKNNMSYPYVADVHVSGREKPFTVYLTREKEAEVSQFIKNKGNGE